LKLYALTFLLLNELKKMDL